VKKEADPFVSDPSRDLWFWCHSESDGRHVVFSNKPHERLPHYCRFHDWYVSEACTCPHDARARAWVDGRARKPRLAKTSPKTPETPRRRTAVRP